MRARLGQLVHAWRGFRGHLDGLIDGAIIGWAAPSRGQSAALRVGLFTPEGQIAEVTANIFRGDLLSAGIGQGYHGFVIPLDPVQRRIIATSGGKIMVRVLGFSRGHLGQMSLSQGSDEVPPEPGTPATGDTPKGKSEALRQFLHGDLERLADFLRTKPRPPLPQGHGTLGAHGPLFDRGDRLNGGDLPAPMSGYADYVRYRYKLDKPFDIHDDPDNTAHFLNWYLAGYATLRQGLRVPMSAEMIAWCNEPVVIPSQRATLSRATWSFLMGVPPILHSMNFQNPAWVDWAVYWWSINQAKALHSEDCLVPQNYIDRLLHIPEGWQGKSFAPSEFMLRLMNESESLSTLDLDQETDRQRLAMAVMVMAVSRPDFLRYLPQDSCKALLGSAEQRDTAFSGFLETLTRGGITGVSRAEYAHVLALRGFDLDRCAFNTFTPEGHRVETARMPAVTGEKVDLQVIGPFEKASGLGQATRLSALALAAADIEINAVDFDLDNPAPEGFSQVGTLSEYRPAKINLLHLNAESIPLAFAYQPDVFTGAYNIGYFFWELDSPAACHHLALDLLDEIWVSTEYGVSIYKPATDKPVVNVGMCVEDLPDITRKDARAFVHDRFGYQPDTFVFLVAFDSFSFVQRKNPVGTLEAFLRAFPGDEDVRLVIKTQNRRKVTDPVQQKIWETVDTLIARDKRITVMDETLTYKDLLLLKKGCDCYVSLHKSEGWGFGMIEAMNLGTSVICTGYSGNLDFCAADATWLVGYTETELGPDDYIFVIPGQKWAEPNLDEAVDMMRAVVENPQERIARAAVARKRVQAEFTARPIGERYAARLATLLRDL